MEEKQEGFKLNLVLNGELSERSISIINIYFNSFTKLWDSVFSIFRSSVMISVFTIIALKLDQNEMNSSVYSAIIFLLCGLIVYKFVIDPKNGNIISELRSSYINYRTISGLRKIAKHENNDRLDSLLGKVKRTVNNLVMPRLVVPIISLSMLVLAIYLLMNDILWTSVTILIIAVILWEISLRIFNK